jgi:hypothetical protein
MGPAPAAVVRCACRLSVEGLLFWPAVVSRPVKKRTLCAVVDFPVFSLRTNFAIFTPKNYDYFQIQKTWAIARNSLAFSTAFYENLRACFDRSKTRGRAHIDSEAVQTGFPSRMGFFPR